MGQAEAEGAEKESVNVEMLAEEPVVAAVTVIDVTDDGMADMGHVTTQLVGSAVLRTKFDQ